MESAIFVTFVPPRTDIFESGFNRSTQGRRKQIFVGAGTPVSMMYIKSICLFVAAYKPTLIYSFPLRLKQQLMHVSINNKKAQPMLANPRDPK